jgi:hypothetical protein
MKTKLRAFTALGFAIALLAAFGIGMQFRPRAAKASAQWSIEDIPAGQVNNPAQSPSLQQTHGNLAASMDMSKPVENNPDQVNNSTNNGAKGDSVDSAPSGEISYQGRLLQGGSVFNGSISLTFSLYSQASGGSAWWTETLTVTVAQGLFNVMLGTVTPINPVFLDYQAWLGIQPAGAASELSPRQLLGASPYAMSLVPGATMYDPSLGAYNSSFWINSDNHVALHAESANLNAIESKAYADGTSGVFASGAGDDGHGVSAAHSGSGGSCPGDATECGSALYANSTGDSYGIFIHTTTRSGVMIKSESAGYWNVFDRNTFGPTHGGIYTNGPLTVLGYATFSGGKSGYVVDIAKNGGSQPLERGDLVVIIGSESAVVGDIPVASVGKANMKNATSIMGVVDVLYEPCDKPQDSLQSGEKCGGFDPSITTIQPGQYLSVVTLGAYGYLKVDATNNPIQAGDLLVSTDTGAAAKAVQITVNEVSFYAPGTIIGKALGSLDSGVGYIPVFVSAH